jgi:hypothetical protein
MPLNVKEPYFQAPPTTAADLEGATACMESYTKVYPGVFGFEYDGKVNPTKYGSIATRDFGFCYET